MAWLTVDKDGTEIVWDYRPLRNKFRGIWQAPYSDEDTYLHVELPKGSIEKLIGKTLSWEDEPYEMEE